MTYVFTWLRGFCLVPAVFLHTMACSACAIIAGALGFHSVANLILHRWARGILWMSGVKVSVLGRENIPAVVIDPHALARHERGVLFLFNHQSFYDIFAIHSIVTQRVRFGSKIELFKVPLFGLAMRAVGVLPIAREKRETVMQVYRNAEEKFASGWSFVLAPEGMRQNAPVIGRFKRGPFIFAINSQATIVPVVIQGSYDVFQKYTVFPNVGAWRRTINVHFLPAVETKGLALCDCETLVETVREKMLTAYEQRPI